jgi:hypothetical protein
MIINSDALLMIMIINSDALLMIIMMIINLNSDALLMPVRLTELECKLRRPDRGIDRGSPSLAVCMAFSILLEPLD